LIPSSIAINIAAKARYGLLGCNRAPPRIVGEKRAVVADVVA